MKKLSKYYFGFIVGLSAFVLLSGCGEIDKKEVSKENFTRVLNDYYARNCEMLAHGKFPQEMIIGGMTFGNYDEIVKRMEALEKLGYLTSKKIKKTNKHESDKKLFSLTEKGKKIYNNKEKHEGLCAFTKKIKSIDNYTEPANMMGVTMTRVEFTFKPVASTDILKEMKKEKVLSEYIDEISNKTTGRADLILTGMKGWVHQREFRR